ncbi:hypothetical protein CF335_g8343 [Tilletia laevis]|nr:hypothetical protein CF335_g8343 [Tilletia laevis]
MRQDVDDRTISAISTLQALRQQDTSSSLVPPTTTAIREALRSRYASLDRWKIDAIENALEVLKKLFTMLQRNGDDEDTNFSSFGHDVIGTFAYRSQLKCINAFGGVQGACRLLAALLRIWSMSKEQLKERPDDRNAPIVEIHIPPAANVILKAFSPTDDDDEEEREIGCNTTAGTMPRASQPQTSRPSLAADANEDRDGHHHNNAGTNRLPLAASQMASSSRGRGAVELKKGVVTEASLKSLGKAALVEILGHASEPFDKVERKESLLSKLVAGVENGAIVLTVTQVKCAKAGLPIPDVKDIKGTRKAKKPSP